MKQLRLDVYGSLSYGILHVQANLYSCTCSDQTYFVYRRRDSDIFWMNDDGADKVDPAQGGYNGIQSEDSITYGSYLKVWSFCLSGMSV